MARRRHLLLGVALLLTVLMWLFAACSREAPQEPSGDASPTTGPPPRAECPRRTNGLSFIAARGDREHVYRLDIRRPGSVERVTSLEGLAQTPTWSPDGERLAFQWLEPGADAPGVYILDSTGAKPRLLASGVATPAWSPDGHTLAVANLQSGRRGISIVDVRSLGKPGTLRVRVVTRTGDMVPEEWPQWTPDGTHILFTSQRGGSSDVWITDLEGHVRVLTPEASLDTTPSMSPDGKWIAFGSNRDADDQGGGDIYVMPSDGSSVTRITRTQNDYDPAWSPDGRFIAFTSQEPGHSAIYLMKPDGSQCRRLTRGREPSAMPAWIGNCRTVPD